MDPETAKRKRRNEDASLPPSISGANKRPSRDKLRFDKTLVKNTNTLSTAAFQSRFVDPRWLTFHASQQPAKLDRRNQAETELEIEFKSAPDLSEKEVTMCLDLVASTSQADYEKSRSFGWHPDRKRREMCEREMRYLLVRRRRRRRSPSASGLRNDDESDNTDDDDSDRPPATTTTTTTAIPNAIQAFLSLLPTHDSLPHQPVIYIYEIHLSLSLRGLGLGKHLMLLAERIASRVGVEKTMLTCFVPNERALGFYRSRGYERDVSSPCNERKVRGGLVGSEVEYVILSKRIEKASADGR